MRLDAQTNINVMYSGFMTCSEKFAKSCASDFDRHNVSRMRIRASSKSATSAFHCPGVSLTHSFENCASDSHQGMKFKLCSLLACAACRFSKHIQDSRLSNKIKTQRAPPWDCNIVHFPRLECLGFIMSCSVNPSLARVLCYDRLKNSSESLKLERSCLWFWASHV